MSEKKERLIIEIGIVKDKHFAFTDKGNIKLQCPSCDMSIEIILEGLPDDASLSPTVKWRQAR